MAEKGVMPPAQAVDAVSPGVMPASTAPALAATGNVHQQTVQRGGGVWSDLRKGVLLGAFGCHSRRIP